MSKPRALPSPLTRASRPAPTAPPAGPGEDAPGAGPRRLLGRGDAAGGLHHQRLRAAPPPPPPRRAGRGSGRAAGSGRRRSRSSSSARTRGSAAAPRARRRRGGRAGARAGARRCARSWRGVEVGEEQADRDRLGAAASRSSRPAARARPSPSGSSDALGPDPLVGLEAQLGLDQRRRLRGAEAVEVGAVLAADLEQVGEAAGGDQRRAGAAFLEQRVGPDRHPVGEDLDRRRRSAPARASTASIALITPADSLAGRGRDLGGVDVAAVEQDRVGEGPADVDPEQHRLKLPPLLAADLAVGGEDEVDPVERRVGLPGSRCAGGRRATRAGSGRSGRSPAPAGRGWRSARPGRRGCASARRGARPRRGSPAVGGSKGHSGGAGRCAAADLRRPRPPRRGCRRRSTR